METKKFPQEEVNRIVALRLKRERERLAKESEKRMKRCMASIHLMLHQEMCAMKRDMAAETQDLLNQDIEPKNGPGLFPPEYPAQKNEERGGE